MGDPTIGDSTTGDPTTGACGGADKTTNAERLKLAYLTARPLVPQVFTPAWRSSLSMAYIARIISRGRTTGCGSMGSAIRSTLLVFGPPGVCVHCARFSHTQHKAT